MSRLDRLLRLRELNEQARVDALARSRRARIAAETQAEELGALKSDYAQRISAPGSPRSGGQMADERRFYGQLHGASTAQAQAVGRLRSDEASRVQQYNAAYRHRRALEGVLTKREEADRVEARRAERRTSRPTSRISSVV